MSSPHVLVFLCVCKVGILTQLPNLALVKLPCMAMKASSLNLELVAGSMNNG